MVIESRTSIYDYLINLFSVVSDNIYPMDEPQELTESDARDGFIVIRVGTIQDFSAFTRQAYGQVRCYACAYVPPRKRGRLDRDKYAAMEEKLLNVIEQAASMHTQATFSIMEEEVLTFEDVVNTNADNLFFMLVKSFIVTIDEKGEDPFHYGDLYIGVGGDSLSTMEDVEALTNLQHYNRKIVAGDYEIVFPETAYLWVCTTDEVKRIESEGFEVPYDEEARIGNLRCYRSSNSIIQGLMQFTLK